MTTNLAAHEAFRHSRGELPLPCEDCGNTVHEFGSSRGFGNIHHIDEDPTNNDPANLMLLHHECHTSLHMRGKPSPTLGRSWTPERRTRQVAHVSGAGNPFYGKTHTEQTRVKMRAGWSARHGAPTARRGRPLPEAVKEKMRGPRKRKKCADCGREWGGSWIKRHKLEGHCVV